MGKSLRIVDFDEKFDPDRVVTNSTDVENGGFTEDGIFSEKIFGNFHSIDRELREGWIDFGDNYVINPLIYPYLSKVIPNLKRMINTNKSLDVNGEEIVEDELDGIGLSIFHENFNDFLEEYGIKDIPEYTFIMNNYDVIFVNKYPILHAKIRPGMIIGNTVNSYKINDNYKMIVQYSKELKEYDKDVEGDFELNDILFNLQTKLNEIVKDLINDLIRKKKGFFRSNCLGSRINNSARNIITPLIGYRIDEIALPYLTYMELYKKQLINLISSSKNITKMEAKKYWREYSLGFDEKMYRYILELNEKTKGGQYMLINRPPTIQLGSTVELKIAKIKTDYSDKTLSISNNLLDSFAGDYDGDVLTLIPLFNKHLVEAFSVFSPAKLIVNANDGSFNRDFFVEKEQKTAMFILNH
jgi:hypothetical protein